MRFSLDSHPQSRHTDCESTGHILGAPHETFIGPDWPIDFYRLHRDPIANAYPLAEPDINRNCDGCPISNHHRVPHSDRDSHPDPDLEAADANPQPAGLGPAKPADG